MTFLYYNVKKAPIPNTIKNALWLLLSICEWKN